MIAENRGDKFDPTDTKGPFEETAVPQRLIYMKIWPDITKELTPHIPYWPTSPFGGDPTNDPTIGDVHQWNGKFDLSITISAVLKTMPLVWHLKQLHYQTFPTLGGRFVSEFGMHGLPSMRTIRTFAPDEKDHYPNSRIMDTHNKSRGGENKIGKYLWSNFKIPRSFVDFIYLSQLMQCEALDYALIHWRREWRGKGKELNAGSLIWQLNDSNPTTSWALVDYYNRRKPAFYTSAKAFAKLTVGIKRTPVWNFIDWNDPPATLIPNFEIWGSSFKQEEVEVELRLTAYDLASRKGVDLGKASSKKVTLGINSTTEITELKDLPDVVTEDSYLVLAAFLIDVNTGKEIARKVSWPEPYRYLDVPNEKIEVKVDGDKVTVINGSAPVKGLLLYADEKDGEEPDWLDNMFDLMPGEQIEVEAKGLGGRNVIVKHLMSLEYAF